MLGLLPAQTGSLTVLNQGVTFGHPPQKIAYVPQKVTQAEKRFPITVQEVVALGMVRGQRLFQWLTPTDQQLINESLATVGLADKKHQQLTSLSGGQQQRVFIAKALAANPQLLILDEPTVGIDQQSQRQFYNLLSHLNREHHLTIILVSHDIDVIVNEVSTVLCLNKNLIYHGNPQKFIKADYLEKLYGENRRYVIHGH